MRKHRSKSSSRGTLSSESTSFQSAKDRDRNPIHRVDLYSGPDTLPFSKYPATDFSKTFYTPPESPSSPVFSEPPLLPPKKSRSPSASLYPLRMPSVDRGKDTDSARSPNIWTAMENEEIVMSSKAVVKDKSERHPRREQRSSAGPQQPPVRPPKPKQYKIKPSYDDPPASTLPNKRRQDQAYKDKRAQTLRKRPDERERARKKTERSRSVPKTYDRRDRSKTATKSRPRHRSSNRPSEEKVENENETKLKQLQKQEDLLKQIIQGIAEAEMMQNKIERTKRWSKEQKAHTQQRSKTKRRHTTVNESNKKERRERKTNSRPKRPKSIVTPD